MGITQVIEVKDFFTNTSGDIFCPGRVCRVPIPHFDPVPRILDVERKDPDNHDEVEFILRNANRNNDFRKQDRSLPVKNLSLRSHEELLAQRSKKRLALFVGADTDQYPEVAKLLRQLGKRHIQDDSNFVIPIYSASDTFRPTGIPPEVLQRTKYLLYRQFFYIPPFNEVREGIARFDRTYVVVGKDPSQILPTGLCLSEEAFALMLSLFVYCLTGRIDDKTKEIVETVRICYEGH